MAFNVRKNDVVEVISGDHRGARGKVLRIDRTKRMVLVEGVNMVFRHVRPSRRNPQGGRVQKEAPIHLSNVLPYDAAKGRGTRVHFEVKHGPKGKVVVKKRVSSSGTTLHSVSRAQAAT